MNSFSTANYGYKPLFWGLDFPIFWGGKGKMVGDKFLKLNPRSKKGQNEPKNPDGKIFPKLSRRVQNARYYAGTIHPLVPCSTFHDPTTLVLPFLQFCNVPLYRGDRSGKREPFPFYGSKSGLGRHYFILHFFPYKACMYCRVWCRWSCHIANCDLKLGYGLLRSLNLV